MQLPQGTKRRLCKCRSHRSWLKIPSFLQLFEARFSLNPCDCLHFGRAKIALRTAFLMNNRLIILYIVKGFSAISCALFRWFKSQFYDSTDGPDLGPYCGVALRYSTVTFRRSATASISRTFS
jgi:hypothetical protein